MDKYEGIQMNLGELVDILVEAGKLPRNKEINISVHVPESSQDVLYSKWDTIKFEAFERVVPVDKKIPEEMNFTPGKWGGRAKY